MRAEYKRDADHNYLILYGEQEVDTASYQVRMLVGNVIPSILKCRIQGLDGKTLFYYEITSRQSVASLYEQRKFGRDDLRVLFGGFVQVMEEMGEYLLNPGYLVLQPEYIYLDVEKGNMGFCYLPGTEREIRMQLQSLTEYVLPRLDHEDSEAVILGYGVYRRALEDCFHLESIKEELYQERRKGTAEAVSGQTAGAEKEGFPEAEEQGEDDFSRIFSAGREEKNERKERGERKEKSERKERNGRKERSERNENSERKEKNGRKEKSGKKERDGDRSERAQEDFSLWKMLAACTAAALGMLSAAAATLLGYLPRPGMEGILMGTLACLAGGMFVYFLLQRFGSSKEQDQPWREKVQKKQASFAGGAEREIFREEPEDLLWEREPAGAGEEDIRQAADPGEKPKREDAPGGRQEKKLFSSWGTSPQPREEAFGETVVLSSAAAGPVSLVSREPGELATIYLTEDLTVIGKLESASDAVISLPTVSRVHAKIRRRDGEYYLTDLNSRNGTSVNGRMLKGDEEYQLQNEDEVDFAQARYVFLK